jgi:hypothetical protein
MTAIKGNKRSVKFLLSFFIAFFLISKLLNPSDAGESFRNFTIWKVQFCEAIVGFPGALRTLERARNMPLATEIGGG